jgi:FtsH-binding integral membrane protein
VSYIFENSGVTYQKQTDIVNKSFAWMFVGLMCTGVMSFVLASNAAFVNLISSNMLVFFGLILVELGLVFFLSARIQRISYGTALTCFLLYSLLNGVTLSAIFLIYTANSVAVTFLITGVLFGVMALYGFTTKKDLTSIGNLALMALIGVILVSVVNLFLQSDTLTYVISFVAIAIFIGLTAYDTQKIKRMAESGASENMGILGALTLYLDFINLFLNLLRLLGKRSN